MTLVISSVFPYGNHEIYGFSYNVWVVKKFGTKIHTIIRMLVMLLWAFGHASISIYLKAALCCWQQGY